MSREYAERLSDKKYLAPALTNSVDHARNHVTRNMDPQWMCL
jgi:hypothetical protein